MVGRGRYVIDHTGEPLLCDDLLVWATWFETANRVLEQTVLGDAPEVMVSTVFLGLDHNWWNDGPPLLWETMVFGGQADGQCRRYTSRAAAVAGHQSLVQQVAGHK